MYLSENFPYLGDGGRVLYFEHDAANVEQLYAPYGWRVRVGEPLPENGVEPPGKVAGGCVECRLVAVFEVDVDEPGEGRIVELLPLGNLSGVHRRIVVSHDLGDDRVLRLRRLQYDASLPVFAAGAAGRASSPARFVWGGRWAGSSGAALAVRCL